jgi:hypothetical protein
MPLPLNHSDLDDLEPILDRLTRTAHATGEQYMMAQGLTLEALKDNPKARKEFIRRCHYGFDLAQRQSAKLVAEYELRVRELTRQLKEVRRAGGSRAPELKCLIEVLENRQLVLRRLVDSILCVILMPDTWVLRRLSIGLDIKRIDPEVLLHTVEVAVDRNREDRMRFSIVSDLTTVIGMGDLFEVDRAHGRRYTLLELKEGKVNELITDIMETQPGELTSGDVDQLFQEHDESVKKQAHRVFRQARRLDQLTQILNTDSGISPDHEMPMELFPDRIDLDDYSKAIRLVCDNAAEHRVGAATVSCCLHLVAVNPAAIPGPITMGMASHVFYHLANPGTKCVINDKENAQQELRAMAAQAPVVDLITLNLTNNQAIPLQLWTKLSRGQDLIFGRLRLFAQWDIEAFFRLAQTEGLTLSWITGKESDHLRKVSVVIPGSPNSRGVRVEYADGAPQTLLSGFFARPVLHLTPPRELIMMIKKYPEQRQKINARHKE